MSPAELESLARDLGGRDEVAVVRATGRVHAAVLAGVLGRREHDAVIAGMRAHLLVGQRGRGST